MRVSIVGPLDFSLKGKYPEANEAGEKFVQGMVEGLARYTTIIGGGQDDGVDRWVRHAFDMYKDKKRFHFTEYPPQHIKGAKWHELDWTTRAKNIIRESEKMFAVLPEEYSGGTPEADILALARISHVSHTIVYLTPRGDVANYLEVKPKDTFIPVQVKGAASKEDERIDAIPRSGTNSERGSKQSKVGDRGVLPFRFAPSSSAHTRRPKVQKKVRVAPNRTAPKRGQVRGGQRRSDRDVRKKRNTGRPKLSFRFKK